MDSAKSKDEKNIKNGEVLTLATSMSSIFSPSQKILDELNQQTEMLWKKLAEKDEQIAKNQKEIEELMQLLPPSKALEFKKKQEEALAVLEYEYMLKMTRRG